jgi:glycosyltransferase involved in cell wall biosynthesis
MKKSFIRWFLLAGGLLIPLVVIFMSARAKKNTHISAPLPEKSFVIIVPSYNNSAYCEQNILSILNQQYHNFRVVFIDDASKDDTFDKVKGLVDRSSHPEKVAMVKNPENQGSLKNLYTAIHGCKDNEIVVRVDGDDFLAHPFVLKRLNKVYSKSDIWMTYGNYLDFPTYKQKPRLCEKFPMAVLKNQRFRNYKWVTHHLHSFYAGLFKKISPEYLMKDGNFLPMAGDVAFVTTMLEMAAGHFQYIDEVLYLYNRSNPLNDHKVNLVLQSACERYVRSLPSCRPLDEAPYMGAEAVR